MNKFAPLHPKVNTLLHGADYNPEQWENDPDIIDKDIAMMQQARLPDPPPPVEQQMLEMSRHLLANQARRGLTDAKFVASCNDQVRATFKLLGLLPVASGAAG